MIPLVILSPYLRPVPWLCVRDAEVGEHQHEGQQELQPELRQPARPGHGVDVECNILQAPALTPPGGCVLQVPVLRAAVQPEHHRAARDRAAALRHHVRRRPQRGHALSSQSQVSIQWCSTNERRVLAAADLDGGGGHGDRGVDVRPGHGEEDGGEGGDGEPRHQPAVRLTGHLRATANQHPVLRSVCCGSTNERRVSPGRCPRWWRPSG